MNFAFTHVQMSISHLIIRASEALLYLLCILRLDKIVFYCQGLDATLSLLAWSLIKASGQVKWKGSTCSEKPMESNLFTRALAARIPAA